MGGNETRFCNLCGKGIAGRYYQYTNGMTVCELCEQTAPRCARCRAPTSTAGATVSRRGVLLCARCSHEINHCDTCGEPILNRWSTVQELVATPAPRRYCEECMRSRPHCDLCQAPVGAGHSKLPDGQYRCALCTSDLVTAESAIHTIYTEALKELGRIVSEPLRQTPPLEVVTRRRMGETRRAYANEAGLTTRIGEENAGGRHVLGFFVRSQGRPKIYVEAGLTRGLLLGTLAHELGHAWQSERLGAAAGAVDSLVSEGFAEWVAYHTLLAHGLRALASRARERDDLYGRGLMRMLSVEQSRGRGAVLAIARAGRL